MYWIHTHAADGGAVTNSCGLREEEISVLCQSEAQCSGQSVGGSTEWCVCVSVHGGSSMT